MRKDGTQSTAEERKDTNINIRLKLSDKEKIEAKAKAWGLNLTQAAYRMLFIEKSTTTDISDVKRKAAEALNFLTANGRDLVSEIASIHAEFDAVKGMKRADGTAVIDTERLRRFTQELSENIAAFNDNIDRAMDALKVIEFTPRGRKKQSAQEDEKSVKVPDGDYSLAMLKGRLVDDPKGVSEDKYIVFTLAVNKGDKATFYPIWSKYDSSLLSLRKGQLVTVEGRMSWRKRKDAEGKEVDTFSIWQDKVSVVTEEDNK